MSTGRILGLAVGAAGELGVASVTSEVVSAGGLAGVISVVVSAGGLAGANADTFEADIKNKNKKRTKREGIVVINL